MAMLDTQLDFGGSPSANIGPGWWGEVFHPVKRLPGQLLGLGYALTNTVSDHAAVDKAESLYRAAGFSADCREDAVTWAPGSPPYFNRACSINGKDGFGVDNVVGSYPNGLPSYFIQQINEAMGLNTYSDPNRRTLYDSNVTTPPASASGGSVNDTELAGARQALMSAMTSNGVAGNAALLAKLETAMRDGVAWWMQSHSNYAGLSAWTTANANEAVQSWMRELGVKAPDGAAKQPTNTGSGQGGNTDTPGEKQDDTSLFSSSSSFSISSPMVLIGAAVVVGFMMMNKGGR